ncbi:MAG: 30S ribosomal protein S17 [Candidatus Omnitrophica bacterium]|nr:30S ribosomal protein S17 [Candidatus Omnitrophota bacterium]
MPNDNTSKRILVKTGTVVSDKMHKTIVVRIDSVTHHAKYSKILRRAMKVKVHDEKNAAKTGDTVKIIQIRPLSKDKRWKLVEIVNAAAKA